MRLDFESLGWALDIFAKDSYESIKQYLELPEAGNLDIWIFFFFITYSIVFLSSFILTYFKHSFLLLIVVEALLILMILSALFIPSRSFSYFLGVSSCAYAMTIHARVFQLLMNESKRNRHSKSRLEAIQKATKKTFPRPESKLMEFKNQLMNIIGYGVPNRIEKLTTSQLPDLSEIFHGFFIMFVGDLCTFLLREYIPIHISPNNRQFAIAVVGALWQTTAIEYAYWIGNMIGDYFGCIFPPRISHSNPLLSVSLSEFWGIRWNPIVAKLLQDSIYVPLRSLGFSRNITILACFTGSALLHSLPIVFYQREYFEFSMMFSFFFVQGFSILLETFFRHHFGKLFFKNSSIEIWVKNINQKQGIPKEFYNDNGVIIPDKLASYYKSLRNFSHRYFIDEVVIMMFIFSFLYTCLEYEWNLYTIGFNTLLLIYVSIEVIRANWDKIDLSKEVLYQAFILVLGWMWTVTCVMVVLQLYTIPMMNVIREMYSRSYFVGPFIRTTYSYYEKFH